VGCRVWKARRLNAGRRSSENVVWILPAVVRPTTLAKPAFIATERKTSKRFQAGVCKYRSVEQLGKFVSCKAEAAH
jgi:hypothetical protein